MGGNDFFIIVNNIYPSVADFNFRERQREMVFQYIAIITIKY